MTTETAFAQRYQAAMDAAALRFKVLADTLTIDLGLDVEPVVDQTGGMVMCLGIYWPDDEAWVWFSDYWWQRDSLILGLYDNPEADGVYPEPPAELVAQLASGEGDLETEGTRALATAISAWATPLIAEHGRKHGWERRF